MTAPDSPPVRSEIRREASRWFVELNDDPLDEQTRQQFDRWLRRSPEHVLAFLQISAHWEEGVDRSAPTESLDELIALAKSDSNVVTLDGAAPALLNESGGGSAVTERLPPGAERKTMRILGAWLGLAACVLISVATALVWQQFFRGVYRTGVGEQRSLTLDDGSTVNLNSGTRIRVQYDDRERHIELLEGQALFQVAKNPSQPFVVRSGDTLVRAVGTQFDVYRKQTGTVVTVLEGRVAILSAARNGEEGDAAPPARVSDRPPAQPYLDAGQQITVDASSTNPSAPAQLEPSGIEAATAWTHRRLIFKSTALSEVVSEFNRYSERPIVVSDADIAAIPISGSFSSSDPTDLLRFLREVGGYDVRETSSAIEIHRSRASTR
jgi:transmembrane sensor